MKRMSLVSKGMIVILSVAMLSACSSNEPKSPSGTPDNGEPVREEATGINESGFPIVDEPITLTAMVRLSPSQPTDWNEILVWQRYEEMTGIKIEWDEYTSADIEEKRNLALASDQLPDIFFRTLMPDNNIDKYGRDGSFIRLNELIDQHAPNIKKILDEKPGIRKAISTSDGSIYSLPNLFDAPSIQVNRKLFMNREWLEATNQTMPTTTDELYEVLKGFRDGDPNQNQQVDEIPLTADKLDDIIVSLRGAFGLANRGGRAGAGWDIDPESGDLRFFPASEGYKEMLAYLHKLYTEKLLDQEIFTTSGTELLAKNEQNLVGSFSFGNVIARANSNAEAYAGLEAALIGPKGDQMHSAVLGDVGSRGAFLISKTNPHPEASIRWIDYLYSDEGARMLFLGFEGETYEQKPDGSYEFLPEIIENIPEGSSFDQVTAQYVPYAGGSLPTVVTEQYFKGGETQPSAKEASANLLPYVPEEVWEFFSFTAEESDEKLTLEADINGLVTQKTAEFVQGKASLDDFNTYVTQLERMGLDRLKEIYTSAYERYKQ
ncbi:extracellular solute-binding protein [Paenibacillus chungangensis]|uniref:Extracellular solute-binding protein n=1 Tax=Paenibacillus chungangensis TaxID=696535 RepID=A0ABW3HLV0_9BACL